jgi:hypothetical protein
MIYGSIFLVGWKFGIPNLLEMWLWRVSSIVLVSHGARVSLTLIIKIPFPSISSIAEIRTQQLQAGRMMGVSNAVKCVLLAVILVTWDFTW